MRRTHDSNRCSPDDAGDGRGGASGARRNATHESVTESRNENATVTGVSPTGKQSTDSTITLTVSISGSGDDSESSN